MNRKSKRIESNTEETGAMIGSNVIDLFKSVRYYPSGDLDNDVSELLEVGGAKYCQYLCHLCTHCIVGKSADDAEMEVAIDVYGIPAVSQDWVLGSVKCGKLFPTTAFSPSKDQLMSGVRVCISGVGRKDACSIFAMVTFYGGRVDPLLTEATTHLVTTKDRGECYEKALARKDVFVVTPDWVSDSVRHKIKCIEMIYHPRLLVTSPQMVNDGVETVCKEEAHVSSPQRIGESATKNEGQEAAVFTTPQQSILNSEGVADGFEEKQFADVQRNTVFNSLQDLAIPLDHNYSNASKMETATEIMDEASKEAVVRKGRKRVSWCLDFSTSPERKTPISSQLTNKKSKHKNKAKKEDLKIEDYMGGLEKIPPARCRRPKSTDTTNPLKKEKPIKDSTNFRAKRAVVKRFVSSDSDTLATNIQSERQNQNKRYSKSRKKYKNKDKKEDLKMKDFKGGLKNPPKKEKVIRDWKRIVRAKRLAMTCQSDSDTPSINIQTELENQNKQYSKSRKKRVPKKTKVTTAKRGLTKNSEMTSVSGLDSPTIIKQTELQNLQKQHSKSAENPISVDHNQNMERTVKQHSNIKIISFNQGTQIKQAAESYLLPQVSTSTSQPDSICTSTETLSTAQLEEGKPSGDYNSSSQDLRTSCRSSFFTSPMSLHGNFTSHKSQVTEKKARDYDPTPLAVSTFHTNPILTKRRVFTGNFSSHASQSAGDCDPPPLVVSRHPTIFTSPMMPPSNARILTSMYLKLPPHTSTFPRQDPRVDGLGTVMNQQECVIRRQAPLSNQQDSLPVTVENLPASVPATSEENKKLPLYWTVEETIKGVSLVDPKLSSHVQIFRSHEIDGRALLMLDLEMMIKYLDMKVGPALKLSNIIEKLKRD